VARGSKTQPYWRAEKRYTLNQIAQSKTKPCQKMKKESLFKKGGAPFTNKKHKLGRTSFRANKPRWRGKKRSQNCTRQKKTRGGTQRGKKIIGKGQRGRIGEWGGGLGESVCKKKGRRCGGARFGGKNFEAVAKSGVNTV